MDRDDAGEPSEGRAYPIPKSRLVSHCKRLQMTHPIDLCDHQTAESTITKEGLDAMRNKTNFAALLVSVIACFAVDALAVEYRDPAGFRVDLPKGWQVAKSDGGHIVIASPNPQKYVFLQMLPRRTADCAGTLRQTLGAGANNAARVEDLQVAPAGPRMAMARFVFQNRQARGATLCAEISAQSAMLYGISAPVDEYDRESPMLVAILKSFSFLPTVTPARGSAAPVSMPPLIPWREPSELAYTIGVPQGWQAAGGIRRQDATHYRTGVQMTSADGGSLIRFGDQRLDSCTVPGPGMAGLPPAQGTMQYCQPQSAAQFVVDYLQRALVQDLRITNVRLAGPFERTDLAQRAQANTLPGLRVGYSVAELHFGGQRNGAPVAGSVLATVTLFYASPGQNFIAATQSYKLTGFVGPAGQFESLARLTGAVEASMRINPVWWSETQRINREIAERTLATMQAEAAHQQQAFWDRMAASDQRREAINDILGGTVRLNNVSAGGGQPYQAKAGSNYYFLDREAARTAGRPEDAVVGTDVWPSSTVDLTPLEVIR